MRPKHDAAKEPVSLVVGVDDAFVADQAVRDQVLADVRRAGLEVVKVMPRIGIVTGRASPGVVGRLKGVAHVVTVERDERRSAGRP